MEVKFERAEGEFDPDRCQALGGVGQCPFKRVPPSLYCSRHSGATDKTLQQEENIKGYRLAKWQARTKDFVDDGEIKSLRAEIGIARMTLETIITQCQTNHDLLLYSNKIFDAVTRIEKLVVTCNRLENHLGLLLDKQAAMQLANEIIEIVSKNVNNPEIIDKIATEIGDSLARIGTSKV